MARNLKLHFAYTNLLILLRKLSLKSSILIDYWIKELTNNILL